MKKTLEMLQRESSATALREEERKAMRDSLMSYMNKHPVPEGRMMKNKAQGNSSGKYLLTMAVAALIVVGGIGTVYAAEKAEPGDMLYSVKTSVNEPMRVMMAISDEQKAKVELMLVTRRIDEAEKLDGQQRLTGETKKKLGNGLKAHVDSVGAHIKKLSANKKTDEAFRANLDLAAAIGGHQQMVNELLGDKGKDEAPAWLSASSTDQTATSTQNSATSTEQSATSSKKKK